MEEKKWKNILIENSQTTRIWREDFLIACCWRPEGGNSWDQNHWKDKANWTKPTFKLT